MKKNALILCPSFSEKGGIAYYYTLINKYFYSEKISIDFYHIGNESIRNQNRLIKSLFDLISLIKIINHYDLILLNPSLDFRSIIRDGIFHIVAKRIFKKKTIIFFHGWMPKMENLIDEHCKYLFNFFFNADQICVLSQKFKISLIRWGFDPEKIRIETTLFEKKQLGFDKDYFKILFLSRFVKSKGCLEAIQTIEILLKDFPAIKLYMVGDGKMISELKNYVCDQKLESNVEFMGYLEGNKKYQILEQCGIMLYPTYREGLPISLLEGMGMGLAIVTRPVGGIPDIITDGDNGFLIPTLNPDDFAIKVKYLLQHINLCQKMGEKNQQTANENFEIKTVVKRLEKLYFEMAQ